MNINHSRWSTFLQLARHCVQSKCFDPILQLLKVLFLFPFCTIITCAHGKKILKSSHTCTATHGESESKGESVSRTCKFLSVCEAAAAVGVMQPAINISEDLHAKEQNVHVSLYCIKTTVCDSSCAPPSSQIRNDRVQGSPSPETNRELRPHFQLHSSAKQTKGCVLETQPVSGFSSARGLCATFSFLSDILNSAKLCMPWEIKKLSSFSQKECLPFPISLGWMLSRPTHQRALMIVISKWLKCSAEAV